MKKSEIITNEVISNAMDYSAYRVLINRLLEEDKVTNDFMKNGKWIVNYTRQNNERMDHAADVFEAKSELKEILTAVKEPWIWLVITEGWCGDAAQIVPAFVKMGELNPNFTVKLILRDTDTSIIDGYLTNGARSIPKLVILNADTLEEIGSWGPRPAVAQQMTMDYKATNDKSMEGLEKYAKKLHAWYENDKFEAIQNELLAKLKTWMKA